MIKSFLMVCSGIFFGYGLFALLGGAGSPWPIMNQLVAEVAAAAAVTCLGFVGVIEAVKAKG